MRCRRANRFARLCRNGLVAGVVAVAAVSRLRAAGVSEQKTARETLITLENDVVRMTVDIRSGAKVTSFFYKPLEREWLTSGQCLFADHVWQQTWPGELFRAEYEYEITERGPERVALRVWRALQEQGKERLTGVVVEREMALEQGSPVVRATVRLRNPTEAVKTVGYWSQHIFRLGGLDRNVHVRPSVDGLSISTMRVREQGRVRENVGNEWVKEPTAGWSAKVNPTSGEAAVFLMDYNDLRWLYNNFGSYTVEWYDDLLRMSPGREWTTEILMLPLCGYPGISFAAHDVIADVRLVRSQNGFRPVYTVGCGVKPLDSVDLKGFVSTLDDTRLLGDDHAQFAALGHLPEELVSNVLLPADSPPIKVTVELIILNTKHTFTRCFAGPSLTDALVPGVGNRGFSVPRPQKVKILPRPDVIRRVPHEGLAVFAARGQFYPAWRLDDALQQHQPFTLKAGHFSKNVYGEQLDFFPAGYEQIMALDAVVLNNVSAECMSANDQALLVDYVEHGGGLLILGGWYAFGGGRYADSALGRRRRLPVRSSGSSDIRRYRDGLPLEVGDGTLFADLDLQAAPAVFWLQEAEITSDQAVVAMTAGGKPFIVLHSYGKGRVACVLAAPCGVSVPGRTLFCEADCWPDVMSRLIAWLKGEAQ